MALAIAGERSGVGKTTVTLAILSYLAKLGEKVQSFKVGPDYIDPMFHTEVTGRPCRNLDPVLTSEEYVRHCFNDRCLGVDLALVEGVMGLFDGIRAIDPEENDLAQIPNDWASTAHIARLLDLPVLLVLDCSRLSGSVAAIAHGYRSFDPRVKIAGLVLNRVGSDRHQTLLQEALLPLQIPILGILHRNETITLRDRHLGLIPTAELSQLDRIFDRLAELAKNCFDWEKLLPLLKVRRRSDRAEQYPLEEQLKLKIAVARDRAFSFYYPDNLELLEQLGAETIPWSPMSDSNLPKGIQGLYFGGGFPEIFARELADNHIIRQAVRQAIRAGIPTYAECGGLMYLGEQIVDFQGQSWPMVGILPTNTMMGKSLALGYRQATALQQSPILGQGETIWGHEFHRSHPTTSPLQPLFALRGLDRQHSFEGWKIHQLHASYIHLHWGAHSWIARRFLQHCLQQQHIARA